jgi:EPS-associated MarR family transcriptional regulator
MPIFELTQRMTDKIHTFTETHLKALRLLDAVPQMSQRDLAIRLDVSLGKTNYCLNALLDRGLLTVKRFHNSQNKLAYAYLLTPQGIAEKTALTSQFLTRKVQEYEALRAEIESLQSEVANEEGIAQ